VKNDDAPLATFLHIDTFLACLKKLKEEKQHRVIETFSPVRLPEMQEIVTPKPSLTRMFTLAGGIIGAVGIVSLAIYGHLSFRLIVYGKPVIAWVPWILVAFEGMVLSASLFAFVSWVFKAGLPQASIDPGYNAALSGHRFGIVVASADTDARQLEDFLRNNGAEEVRHVAS
jgi:hypothetical protein